MGLLILPIDAGKMSGWGLIDPTPEKVFDAKFYECEYMMFQQLLDNQSSFYRNRGIDLVFVPERFVITQRTIEVTRGDWTTKINGCAEYFAHRDFHKYDETQTATRAKKFCGDDLLRQFGWYTKGGKGHHRDAARHGVLYIARAMPDLFDWMLRESE